MPPCRLPRDAFVDWCAGIGDARAPGCMFAFRELVDANIELELAKIISAEHGKTHRRRARRGRPRPRGRRVRLRHPAAAQGRVLRPGLRRRRLALVPSAARRRRRHHAVQLPDHGAAVDAPGRHRVRQHLHAQAERAGPGRIRSSSPSCMPRPVCPTASSTSCTATRWPSTRILDHPGHRARSRSSARPRSRKYVHERATARASGCRHSAARRTTPSSCPTPTSTSPPTTWSRRATARPAQRCMAISAVVAVGQAADVLVEKVREKTLRRSRSAPATSPESRWARSSRAASRDRITGYIGEGESEGATLVGRRPRARRSRATRTASSSARP